MKDIQTDLKTTLSYVAAFIAYAYPSPSPVAVMALGEEEFIKEGALDNIIVLHDGEFSSTNVICGTASLCLFEHGYVEFARPTARSKLYTGAAHRLSQHQRLQAIARYSHVMELGF